MTMTPEEYRQLALKTEHTPCFVRTPHGRTLADYNFESGHDRMLSRMLHALLGKINELGELAGALKAHLIYGKPLDEINLVEELGDDAWYSNLFHDAIGVGFERAWEMNIAKLKKRFGDKFSSERALNRDHAGERAVMERISIERNTVDAATHRKVKVWYNGHEYPIAFEERLTLKQVKHHAFHVLQISQAIDPDKYDLLNPLMGSLQVVEDLVLGDTAITELVLAARVGHGG